MHVIFEILGIQTKFHIKYRLQPHNPHIAGIIRSSPLRLFLRRLSRMERILGPRAQCLEMSTLLSWWRMTSPAFPSRQQLRTSPCTGRTAALLTAVWTDLLVFRSIPGQSKRSLIYMTPRVLPALLSHDWSRKALATWTSLSHSLLVLWSPQKKHFNVLLNVLLLCFTPVSKVWL